MFYHVWFVTKYRKASLVGETEAKIQSYLLEIATNKKYRILEMETNIDHVHLLLEAKNEHELANIMRTMKCVSAKKILEDSTYSNRRHFWAKRYGSRCVPKKQLEIVRKYIRNQKRNIPHT